MTVLSGQSIKAESVISPCRPKFKINGMSGGLSAASYDVTVAESFIMWPGRFKLASTLEMFDMPNNICGEVKDKSTWIRLGLSVHNTFIDPGWKGYLTLELKMEKFAFRWIRKGTPIAQIVFTYLDIPTDAPYQGKYQNQEAGPQSPRT